MNNIKQDLILKNATTLVFDNTKIASRKDTNLLSINGVNWDSTTPLPFPKDHNLYFIFDNKFKCRYVGKKSTGDGINVRLSQHLRKNGKSTVSIIEDVCNYINNQTKAQNIIYVITFKI